MENVNTTAAKSCESKACSSKADALKASFMAASSKTPSASTVPPVTTKAGNEVNQNASKCPPDKEEIGRSGWTLLHSMAAHYPDNPTQEEQSRMRNFLESFAIFYPCSECGHGFHEAQKKIPAKVESRTGLSVWMCDMHNVVNKQLGKNEMKCDIKLLDKRWLENDDKECQ